MKLILRKKIPYLLLGFSLLLIAHAPFSYAAGKIYCSMYAKNAVAQNKQNIANNCGYEGPRWSSDITYHTQRCRDASNAAAVNENLARIVQLGKCKTTLLPVGANKWCNTYTRVSVGQSLANISSKCGFSGPEWNPDYGRHYRWCITASQDLANAQIHARQRQLMNNCN